MPATATRCWYRLEQVGAHWLVTPSTPDQARTSRHLHPEAYALGEQREEDLTHRVCVRTAFECCGWQLPAGPQPAQFETHIYIERLNLAGEWEDDTDLPRVCLSSTYDEAQVAHAQTWGWVRAAFGTGGYQTLRDEARRRRLVLAAHPAPTHPTI